MCLLWRAKAIAQDVADFIGRYRAIWIGHRLQDRTVMRASLRAGNYTQSDYVHDKSEQGLEAWGWLEKKASRQNEAADVALYSIQGLPNNCKKKA